MVVEWPSWPSVLALRMAGTELERAAGSPPEVRRKMCSGHRKSGRKICSGKGENLQQIRRSTPSKTEPKSTFMPMILANSGYVQNMRTAAIVLQSLTPNAQSVFWILAEHQLAHPEEEGLALNLLYTKCREKFIVSSQVTLNSHLTEFKGHELVKSRRNSDGVDCLCIPLPSEALEKLLQEIG